MKETNGFYTMKGYERNTETELTSAMEDYLEMIARLSCTQAGIKAGDLSRRLHVKPSSVTKMVRQLAGAGYLQAEKYGEISLTDRGQEAGRYLLYRHDVLHRFLCTLNGTNEELEQVEKIEHFLSPYTIKNLDRLTQWMKEIVRTDGPSGKWGRPCGPQ